MTIKNQRQDEQTSQGDRRDMLKKAIKVSAVVAGVAAVPAEWKKPIIDSVVIPAHAQSGSNCTGGNPFTPGCS